MKRRFIGFAISSSEVHYAILTLEGEAFEVEATKTLHLQSGERPSAYHVMFDQVAALITERKLECACIKGSALSLAAAKMALLEAAELRGVVQTACASACAVKLVNKANVSRNFGARKVDEYLKDDSFWKDLGLENLAKGKREAAFQVVASFSTKGQK
jgi:hypothetical protein